MRTRQRALHLLAGDATHHRANREAPDERLGAGPGSRGEWVKRASRLATGLLSQDRWSCTTSIGICGSDSYCWAAQQGVLACGCCRPANELCADLKPWVYRRQESCPEVDWPRKDQPNPLTPARGTMWSRRDRCPLSGKCRGRPDLDDPPNTPHVVLAPSNVELSGRRQEGDSCRVADDGERHAGHEAACRWQVRSSEVRRPARWRRPADGEPTPRS